MLDTRTQCPVCRNTNGKLLYQSPFATNPIKQFLITQYAPVSQGIDLGVLGDREYTLLKCPECELLYQGNIPDDAMMQVLYEQWIDPEMARYRHLKKDDVNLFSFYASEIATMVDVVGKVPSEQRFLDFGMGWGKWSLMAKAFGVHSAGSELSDERIANARKLGIEVCSWDDIPGGKFDFINTEQVFEHIPEPLETVLHLKSGLTSDGILKISVPPYIASPEILKTMDWNAARGSKGDLNPVFPLEHINCYSHKSFSVLAEKAGLRLYTLPMSKQYRHFTNWRSLKSTARNLILPVWRNWLKRQNYVFFKRV